MAYGIIRNLGSAIKDTFKGIVFDNGVLYKTISIISDENCAWTSSYPMAESIYIDKATKSIGLNYQSSSKSSVGYLSLDFTEFVDKTVYVTYNINGGTSNTISKVISSTDKYLCIGGNNWGSMSYHIGFLSTTPSKNIQYIITDITNGTLSSSTTPALRVTKIWLE